MGKSLVLIRHDSHYLKRNIDSMKQHGSFTRDPGLKE